jgi:hypothetical protein
MSAMTRWAYQALWVSAVILSAGFAVGFARASEATWPQAIAPEGARVQSVAPDVVLNGKRSRILQIDTPGSVQSTLAFYRKQFGPRHVENAVIDAKVIATREGNFFHTVHIQRKGLEAVQITMITTVLAQQLSRSAALSDTQAWLPHETNTVQTMESTDGGVRSITITAVNQQGLQTNRDLLLEAMQQRGFRVMREDKLAAATAGLRSGVSLWLSSRDEEATVTVADTGEHRALSIVRTRQVK